MAAFQVRPQSDRLIAVVAVKPALVLPHGSAWTPSNSRSKVTERVTPLMVRSPVIESEDTEVETKVSSG